MFAQAKCKNKGLNYLLPTKQELYDEFFNVTEDTKAAVAETEQEKLDRIRQREKNRKTFHKYLRDKVPDKLACALLLTADVVDTKAFNAKRYRPEIDRKGLVAGLVSLGVDATEAENMAEYISTFPLPCKEVIKRVCVLSCQECNQHELFDGTRLKGFLPTRTTVGQKLADWSDWKQANERYGDRRGLGKQYLRNMCQRCDTKRQVIHHRSNEKKKEFSVTHAQRNSRKHASPIERKSTNEGGGRANCTLQCPCNARRRRNVAQIRAPKSGKLYDTLAYV